MTPRPTMVLTFVLMALLSTNLSGQRTTRRIFVTASAGGSPVLDLTAADLSVVENGTKRDVTRVALGNGPMRIVLLVDSSTAVAQIFTQFRPALNTFFETLPPQHEVAFITTGGQIGVRSLPTTDRAKLKAEASRFSSGGGGNSFIETLIESDRRFLKPVPQWPVFVLLQTDNGETRVAPRVDEYNRFMDDFLQRGGSAHGIVIKGASSGPISDIAGNLIQNTGGIYDVVNQATVVEARLKAIAERLASDHAKMANTYEIDFTSDAKITKPQVEVGSSRAAVSLRLLPRRPL